MVDLITDMHQYLYGKRVALWGDPDQLVSLSEFLVDLDMKPVYVITGTPGKAFLARMEKALQGRVPEALVKQGPQADMFLMHQLIKREPVDLLIGNTYGKYIARDEDIPLLRHGFPILDRVGIQTGECVLELGPGPGAFTVDAARRVGSEGRIIAVDIQPEMIAQVEERVREANLSNVETHVASAYELPLENESIVRAFLVTVLPEIPDQNRALTELRRVLKPGGRLSITDEFMDPDYPFPAETIRRVGAAGFELEQRFGGFWVYTINFRRKP